MNADRLPRDHVIGWFELSPDGSRIAYGETASSEYVVVHVCDADGRNDRVQAIASQVIADITWRDERSFYYNGTRQMTPTRVERSYLHIVDSRRADWQIGGYGIDGPLGSRINPSLYETFLVLGHTAVIAMVHNGTSADEAVYVAPYARAIAASAAWRPLFADTDGVVAVAAAGQYIYGLSDRGSARRVIMVNDLRTGRHVRTIIPNDSAFRTNIFADQGGLYVNERLGSEARIVHFDPAGHLLGTLPLPTANVIAAVDGDPQRNAFAVELATFSDPGHWYKIAHSNAVEDLRITPPPPPMYARVRFEDDVATSADGTKIPYTVVYAKGTPRDGQRPAVVFGYGAYGADPLEPPTPPFAAALASLGVVLVLAHIRGGGEFGEPWHLAGKGASKQHSIDDFLACARATAMSGWTSRAKLAGWGASAGGIVIGNAITQDPSLFRVAISQVGVNDMIDYEKAPNGPGNVPEFGSVKTADGFRALAAMSAYDHVTDAPYPATILTTGLSDVRVPTWEVAKMAARLQAQTTSGKPVLLRADLQGHGSVRDVSAQVDEYSDIFTFMLWQFGEPGFEE